MREYCTKLGRAKLQRQMTVTERRHMATVLDDDLQDIEWTAKLASYINPPAKISRFSIGFGLRVRSMPTEYNSKQTEYIKWIFFEGELPNK